MQSGSVCYDPLKLRQLHPLGVRIRCDVLEALAPDDHASVSSSARPVPSADEVVVVEFSIANSF
jgi:hypothetical protein